MLTANEATTETKHDADLLTERRDSTSSAEPSASSNPGPSLDWTFGALPVLAMTLVGQIWATTSLLPMYRDGSYYFLKMWGLGNPLIAHGRIGAQLIQMPFLWLTEKFHNFGLSVLAFDASYAAVPFIALVLSWLCVRKTHPYLMVWPVVAISLTMLSAKADYVSENTIAQQLIWPAFLCLLTKPNFAKTLLILALCAFALSLHPVAIPLMGIMATTAATLAFCERNGARNFCGTKNEGLPEGNSVNTRRVAYYSIMSLIICAAGLTRLAYFILYPQSYEQGLLGASFFSYLVDCGLAFPPVLTALGSIAGGALLLVAKDKKSFAFIASICALVVGGAAAIYWCASPQFWHQSFWYQKVLIVYFAFLMLCALVDSRRNAQFKPQSAGDRKLLQNRSIIWNVVGAISLIAVSIQATTWTRISTDLKTEVAMNAQQLVEREQILWLKNTPFDHWSSNTYAIVMQGTYPHKSLLPKEEIEFVNRTGTSRVTPWDEAYTGNHYRLPTIRKAH
jgi:hypothetical protein